MTSPNNPPSQDRLYTAIANCELAIDRVLSSLNDGLKNRQYDESGKVSGETVIHLRRKAINFKKSTR
jgi:hypothetical protein